MSYRDDLNVELAALIERSKPESRLAPVRAELANLPAEPTDVVETAAVAAPENAARPVTKSKPRK